MTARPVAAPEAVAFFQASAGFVEGAVADVAAELAAWRAELGLGPRTRRVPGPLAAQLPHLNPLLPGLRPRELLVQHGSWVAYFDSYAHATDATSTCSELARRLGVRAFGVSRVAEPIRCAGMEARLGVQFRLWGPGGTTPEGYVRTIDVIEDGGRRHWGASGEPQAFEDTARYANPDIRQRFTVEVLDRYCAALGVDLTDDRSYGSGILVESRLEQRGPLREVWI
ncbi:hypothetical protein AB0I60_19465 [Actinosynnema sp. NPDC050436]|uniref:hypothetical protein n=1 Tax=Actinosynnema sp. NPDC050436 TaxID=3155659 RepID=UPI0033C5C52D